MRRWHGVLSTKDTGALLRCLTYSNFLCAHVNRSLLCNMLHALFLSWLTPQLNLALRLCLLVCVSACFCSPRYAHLHLIQLERTYSKNSPKTRTDTTVFFMLDRQICHHFMNLHSMNLAAQPSISLCGASFMLPCAMSNAQVQVEGNNTSFNPIPSQ